MSEYNPVLAYKNEITMFKQIFQILEKYYKEIIHRYDLIKIVPEKNTHKRCRTCDNFVDNFRKAYMRQEDVIEDVRDDLNKFISMVNNLNIYHKIYKEELKCPNIQDSIDQSIRYINYIPNMCKLNNCTTDIVIKLILYNNLKDYTREIILKIDNIMKCVNEHLNNTEKNFYNY